MKDPHPQIKLTCRPAICLLRMTLAVGSANLVLALAPLAVAQDNENTAYGEGALSSVTTGSANSAFGFNALASDTVGSSNTALGDGALFTNTSGGSGTAVGYNALHNNTTGYGNSAFGIAALAANTTGFDNVAVGLSAASSVTTGADNTAVGVGALQHDTIGGDNVAIGHASIELAQGGSLNTAVGSYSSLFVDGGTQNTSIGYSSLSNVRSGSYNIAVGSTAGSALRLNNNIAIGSIGTKLDSGTIRLGTPGTHSATYIAGISGITVAGGVSVVIDGSGHLGTVTSSARYKEAIKPMDKASEVLLSLKPVTFRYKKGLDPQGIPQFGLVAEEVARVDPDLVARDEEGKPYTVRYEAVNAMLLNEFLKEHRKVETLEKTVAQLQAAIEKVSAQVEAKTPPRLASTDE
ncbi:MAG: tail fiber domain-containing protein [Chthoniobacterales bacterium]